MRPLPGMRPRVRSTRLQSLAIATLPRIIRGLRPHVRTTPQRCRRVLARLRHAGYPKPSRHTMRNDTTLPIRRIGACDCFVLGAVNARYGAALLPRRIVACDYVALG